MNTFNKIKLELDNLSNNKERRKYFESIKNDPNILNSDLRRIAIKVMEEDNFIEKYYGRDKRNIIVHISSYFNAFFTYTKRILKKYKKF